MNHYSHFGMWKSGVRFYPFPKSAHWHHSRGCGRSVFQRSRCSSFGSSWTGVFGWGIPINNFHFSQTVPMCFSQVRPAFSKKKYSLRKIIIKGHVAFLFITAISEPFSVSSQRNKFILASHTTLYLRATFFQGDFKYGQKLNTNGTKFSSHKSQ